MRYPEFGRLGIYATELRDALRRHAHSRKPRVRVRVGDSEPKVLAEDSDHGRRLLDLGARLARPDDPGGGGGA